MELVAIPDGRYNEVLAEVDDAAAEAEAKQWLEGAQETVEPSREDVVKAARASKALEQLIAENRVNVVRGTCMGWLPAGSPAILAAERPGHSGGLRRRHGLRTDDAHHAAGDRQPASWATRREDRSRNAFHLSHCSAPLKMDGPAGRPRYLLRRHGRSAARGDRSALSDRPEDYVHQARAPRHALGLHGHDHRGARRSRGRSRGCRTELVAEVKDADRLLNNWGGGALGEAATDYYASPTAWPTTATTPTPSATSHLLGLKVVEEV